MLAAYTAISQMLDVADDFGEEQVIRDVAKRAGVMWTCVNARCGLDNVGHGSTCDHCSYPAPEAEEPLDQWHCVCGAVTVFPVCSCNRTRPGFRRSQLYV